MKQAWIRDDGSFGYYGSRDRSADGLTAIDGGLPPEDESKDWTWVGRGPGAHWMGTPRPPGPPGLAQRMADLEARVSALER